MESEMAAITLLDGGMGQELVARSGDGGASSAAIASSVGDPYARSPVTDMMLVRLSVR